MKRFETIQGPYYSLKKAEEAFDRIILGARGIPKYYMKIYKYKKHYYIGLDSSYTSTRYGVRKKNLRWERE